MGPIVTEADINQILADLERISVPVVRTELLARRSTGVVLPIAVVDARDRPDVADLTRLHRLEGFGHVRTAWRCVVSDVPGVPSCAWLELELVRPARCRFALCFPLPACSAWLQVVMRVGLVSVTARNARDPDVLVASSTCWPVTGGLDLLAEALVAVQATQRHATRRKVA